MAVAAGAYLRQDGSVGVFSGVSPQAVAASALSYLFLDLTSSGALVVSELGFPSTAHVRLAIVAAGAGAVSGIADSRVAFDVVGSFADGVDLTFGLVTGTQFGTSSTEKLGFFGQAPVIQPVMGSASAGSSYTTTERDMLNAVYGAMVALGLGSAEFGHVGVAPVVSRRGRSHRGGGSVRGGRGVGVSG